MRALSGATLAVASLVALTSVAGCAKIAELQAKKAFKAANQAYTTQDYQKAAELYEEAIKQDPNLGYAYFYLANSYDNLFKPSRRGEAANDALLEKAVQGYQLAAEKLASSATPQDKLLGKRSLEYLVAAYGSDKMADPAKAEPVVQRMIQLEPAEPSNYFALGKIYEDAGAYLEAEQMFVWAKQAKPSDVTVYLQLAGYYNRQGRFDKTIEALEQRAEKEPTNPEAYQMIAGYYYEETNGDARLQDAQKRQFLLKGLEAADRALQLKTDYVDALVFKGLLLRLQANLEKDLAKQQALLKEARELSDRANDLKKKQTTAS